MDYDLGIVGGGLAGSTLGLAMAEHGYRVLVVERDVRFRDRVRGEGIAPWGIPDARTLGIEELLLNTCAHSTEWSQWTVGGAPSLGERAEVDSRHAAGSLTFHHPDMQEVLLTAAEEAGARVCRGAAVVAVAQGEAPSMTVRLDGGALESYRIRLVAGADGRNSRVRTWVGLTKRRAPDRLMVAGVLMQGVPLPEDAVHFMYHPGRGQLVIVCPVGRGRFRCYLIYHKLGRLRPLSGQKDMTEFVSAAATTGCTAIAAANPIGPLATFNGAATWVDHPYHGGIALIGDAAAASDPGWGTGMALALRDVRVLRDELLATEDWNRAVEAYAAHHDHYFAAVRRLEDWMTELYYGQGLAAVVRRFRVLPRLAAEPERAPDILGRGPDGPNDEASFNYFG